jgi:DNA-binding transcriptional regulator YhcF (GntR family)
MSYIKLNRALRDNPIAGDPHYLAVWTWLLMLAAYKPHSVILNSIPVDLKAGDLATSVRILADRTGVKKDKIAAILVRLEKEGMIRRRISNKYTVITLVNWDKFQVEETQQRRKPDASQTGEKKVEEGKRKKVVLPPELDTPEFAEAWAEWEQYRREKKAKLTPTTVKRQLAMLTRLGSDFAIEAISQSIEAGWTGVFPPKQNGNRATGVTIDEALLEMDCARGDNNGSV